MWDGTTNRLFTDGGLTWNTLGTVGAGLNWYDNTSINSSGLPAWSGYDSTWKNAMIKFTITQELPLLN